MSAQHSTDTAATVTGATIACARGCGRSATLLIACHGGATHGGACAACWQSHVDLIESGAIGIASDMVAALDCSRCGSRDVDTAHVFAVTL